MSFKFNAAEKATLEGYIAASHKWQGDMADYERIYDDAVKAATTALNKAIDDYNTFRNEVKNFVEDIHSVASDEYDGRSERWQEGDKGEAVSTWMNQLNEFVLTEDIDLIELEATSLFEHDGFYDELSELPTEPEE